MQRPVQITFRDIAHSEAIESHVRDKVAKLEEFYLRSISIIPGGKDESIIGG